MQYEYHRATSLEDALAVLGHSDEPVRVIAGGTNVVTELQDAGRAPALLLDIAGLAELTGIREEDGKITLGALTSIHELASSELIRKKAPALCEAANAFADPTTRRHATVGGNLCNASPGADSAPPLLVCDAEVGLVKGFEERIVPLEQFITGSFRTALQAGELLKWVRFTAKPESAFLKLGHRNAMAISITTVAVAVETQGDGTLQNCRIAYGASGPTPLRAARTEKLLEGKEPCHELLYAAEETLRQDLSPRDGLRGSLKYRQNVVGTLLRRAVLSAQRAGVG